MVAGNDGLPPPLACPSGLEGILNNVQTTIKIPNSQLLKCEMPERWSPDDHAVKLSTYEEIFDISYFDVHRTDNDLKATLQFDTVENAESAAQWLKTMRWEDKNELDFFSEIGSDKDTVVATVILLNQFDQLTNSTN